MAPAFDRAFWERRWSEVLGEHGDRVAQLPASAYLTDAATDLAPGRALDAGCGHGAETLWLAGHGWQVTAVDFAAAALAQARSTAAAMDVDLAARVTWVEGDLGSWAPEPAAYDLVVSLYVHVAGSVAEMVARLAAGVAPSGTLLLVGHLPVDPVTGEATPAAGQTQVTVAEALGALEAGEWELVVAEDRPRALAGSGHDAVVWARRRP